MKTKIKLLRVPLVLFLAILACNAPTFDEVQEELDLPTAAPSPAPTEAPPDVESTPVEIPTEAPTPLSPVSPITIEATGIKTSYRSFGVCTLPQPMTLTVRGDGTAELSATGPVIVDHYNCVKADMEETWYVNGVADAANESITFSSCNFGGFKAEGTITYSSGGLSGLVFCYNKNGEAEISFGVGKNAPP